LAVDSGREVGEAPRPGWVVALLPGMWVEPLFVV